MQWKSHVSLSGFVLSIAVLCAVEAVADVPAEAIVEVQAQVDGQLGAAAGGDPVYVAQGRRVKVLAGNGDDTEFVHANEMLGGLVESLVRVDDLLIAGWRSAQGVGQLSWFSLADPESPEWLYDFAYKGDVSGRPVDLAAVDDTLYVMDRPVGSVSPPPLLFPLDVSDPLAPTVLEPLELRGGDPTLTVFNESYLLASGTAVGLGVRVIDISDPHAPREVGIYGGGSWGIETGVLAGDDYMVLWGTFDTEIVSLADPTQPERLAELPHGDYWAQNALLVEDRLYLPLVEGALSIWDLSDPAQPIEVAMIDAASDSAKLAARGPKNDQAVFFYPSGAALVVDLAAQSNSTVAETVAMPPAYEVDRVEATPVGPAVIDKSGMLRLYGLDLESIPVDFSEFGPKPYSLLDVHADGLGLLLSEDVNVVSFEEPMELRSLGQLPVDHLPPLRDAVIVEDRAWAIARSSFVEIDLSEPSDPAVLRVVEVDEFDSASSLEYADGHLYVFGYNEGLFIYDVESAASPLFVGAYADCNGMSRIDVEEGLALISCSQDSNSKFLDVTSPEEPVLLNAFKNPGVVEGEEPIGGGAPLLRGTYAWLGLRDHVDLVDIRDPRSPFVVARYNVPGGASDLAPAADGVWVAASEGGMARLATPAPLAPGQTATWYDPERAGEGWIVEMLEDDHAVGYWFTYDADGNQRWLVGTGEVLGSSIVFEMEDVRGGRFGPAFDPDEVVATPAGEVRMMWTGCDRGWYQFVPEEGSDLTVGLRRLTRTLGLEDCSEAPAAEPGRAQQSGSWYDPLQAGQGFSLQWLDNGRAVVHWFTFDSEGNPYWMVGVGQPDGARIVFDDLIATRGGRFGEAFDPAEVEQFHWGELSLELDCSSGSAEYSSVLPEFGSGTFDLERLTVPDGLNCD